MSIMLGIVFISFIFIVFPENYFIVVLHVIC